MSSTTGCDNRRVIGHAVGPAPRTVLGGSRLDHAAAARTDQRHRRIADLRAHARSHVRCKEMFMSGHCDASNEVIARCPGRPNPSTFAPRETDVFYH